VILRLWTEDDADFYADAVKDPEIQRWTREGDVTAEQMRTAIRRLAGHPGAFCIADDDGRAIGNIGWKELDEPGEVEGYYWVAAEARGRGVATSALERLWALAGARRMVLVVDAGNDASCRTAERAGFTRIAATAEALRYERCS
jgi:ribosomal-protein-alanine N-acetyltransferase